MAIGIQSGHRVSGFGFAVDQGGMLNVALRSKYAAAGSPTRMALNDCGCGCNGAPGGCGSRLAGFGVTLPELDLTPGAPPVGLQPGWGPPVVEQAQAQLTRYRAFGIGSLAVHALVAAGGLYLLKKKHPVAGTVVTAWGVLGLIPSLILATNPRNIAV